MYMYMVQLAMHLCMYMYIIWCTLDRLTVPRFLLCGCLDHATNLQRALHLPTTPTLDPFSVVIKRFTFGVPRQHILQSHPHSEAQDVSLACINCWGNTLLTKPWHCCHQMFQVPRKND